LSAGPGEVSQPRPVNGGRWVAMTATRNTSIPQESNKYIFRHVPTGSGILWGARPKSLPHGEVRVEDKDRNNVTVVEAAEYLGLSRTTVQEMVERGVLKADKRSYAGAIHIPREEVERIERETAP
jgi:excisionase family DNA binding protein